jgi:ethanolamine ammonia-lyase small subunit
MSDSGKLVVPNALREQLRRHTAARVGLHRAGAAVATDEQLLFQLDHALARDAVHTQLDAHRLQAALAERGLAAGCVESAVCEAEGSARPVYLRRPDLGRALSKASAMQLGSQRSQPGEGGSSVAFVLADGLSALAVERNALPLLDEMLPRLDRDSWPRATFTIATQARVALGDAIGEALGADLTVMLIGERPGLSAPDSLGVYLTWNPKPGRSDAERNCISNIRQGGLGYAEAADRVLAYMN